MASGGSGGGALRRLALHVALPVIRSQPTSEAAAVEAEVEELVDAIVGPNWDLAAAYPSLGSDEVAQDIAAAKVLIAQLSGCCGGLDPGRPELADAAELAAIATQAEQAMVLLGNVRTFASAVLSTDGADTEARQTSATVGSLMAELQEATAAHHLLLKLCPDGIAAEFARLLPEQAFGLSWDRRLRVLIARQSPSAHTQAPSCCMVEVIGGGSRRRRR